MEKEEDILKKAKLEEKAYNWAEAADLYEEVAKSYFDKKMLEKAAEVYYKLGFAYYRAADTAETTEEYTELRENSARAFKEATNLYKQIKNKPKELECEAFEIDARCLIMSSISEAKKALNKANELYFEASELYSTENDQEGCVRTLSWAVSFLFYSLLDCSDPKEIEELYQKGTNIAFKTWTLSKDIKNVQYLAEALYWEVGFVNMLSFKWDESFREHYRKLLLRCEESLRLVETCEDSRVLELIYAATGNINCLFGYFYIKDELEQRRYIDKGIDYLEKSLELSRKVKDKKLIITHLYLLDWAAFSSGRINYMQKRIVNDINEIVELGKIYEGLNSFLRFIANHLPAFYYATISQWSFFTPAQRKSYAEKGIEYALESLKNIVFEPILVWPYMSLTMSHSILAYLITDKDEKDVHLKKMLQYAKQANEIGEKYKVGFPRSVGYNSLYRAYKTLAGITESEEERIKMLTLAADASEKDIKYAMLSRAGIIMAQMRLGLLYEEIGVLTVNNDILIKAKELFLLIIKECFETGYQSYAAATYEYIARIEDRLGNHTSSAEFYEKSQNAHAESLKNIKYKPLKKRVIEKMNYSKAWSLIESARANHKRENHLKAEESYKNACELLNQLQNFNYEAPYYLAWASQEEAEQLSKLEKHEKAIQQYEMTKSAFNNAIKSMEEVSKHSKDKFAVERIDKLKKVANLRIKYCSARLNVEKARILGKQGEHYAAAELFASAASEFRYVCNLFKLERERAELEAVYYLCRAWETMELAEKYEDPERFAEAANLFVKASKLFVDSKLKLLASGNSTFCQALELGCKFDEAQESEIKAQLYTKIRTMLRKAASSYEKGGFENGGDWALATSTYFDAAWSLIRADEELEFEQRKELLGVGSEYLKSAAELFSKAGYKDKEKEVLSRLNMVEKEEKIIFSALNSIKKPTISSSTVGIIAPTCSLETSQSPRLGDVRQFIEEERRVVKERVSKRKYELVYMDLLEEDPRVQKRECRVAIAQIGLSNTGTIIGEFYKMKTSGLLGLREDKIEIIRTNVKNMIESACEKGANILLFPEMTIDLNYAEFLEDISNLANLYEMYIIPGSYHNQKTKRNVSVVIGPDGILWEQEKHIPAIIHLGKKRFKEAIEIGTLPRKTIVCNTEYGRIAIIICRDFLDMDLRVELKNFEPPVDIILNPAFTPVTADFKAAHFDARRSIYAYCFFANVGEFGDSLIYTPEKERVERTIPPKKEGLIYKDVDLFKLRSERKKWEKEQKKETQFIQSTR